MSSVTVRAERSERWWVLTSEQVPGLVSQARRLDQVEAEVRDALTLFPELDVDPESVEVVVEPVMPGLDVAEQARSLNEQARATQEEASAKMREAARRLVEQGLPLRDVGLVLGVSFQRTQKLTAGPPADAVA